MKRLIENIKAPTPAKNKIRGQISTFIGTVCTVAFSMGGFTNRYVLIALVVGSVTFGGVAISDALKVKK